MSYGYWRVSEPRPSVPPFSRLHSWLSWADAPRTADLIFVLAGRMSRKEFAFELFQKGLSNRILLSVGRFEIRRFSKMSLPVPIDLLALAQTVPPPERHFFVHFQGQSVQVRHVFPHRFGTLTEICAFASWLTHNIEVRSVLLVSSASHLRRIRLCCRALMPGTLRLSFLAAPEADSSAGASLVADVKELTKLCYYWVLLKSPTKVERFL